ncbi:dienelactone hydrolase [Phyllobacterium sp. 628]|uniref:alpha/beta hydrolase family protein n=1 Tax=Phyllobacterium sp. 628 TaxID=2718938 RepID=UPI00166284A4|nr:alpha/beta fold hydrolase [Phyllobacterium sp. 628]QND52509.1 dienelactone hydrolase [Phyllobacterium sp. 628]
MKMFKLAALSAIFALGTLQVVQAAGLQLIEVPQDSRGPAITGAVWSPCADSPAAVKVGSFDMKAVMNCPIVGSRHPLVVVSHGAGGSLGNYHELAELLADKGFIVAAINHPLDSGQSKIRNPGDIASMIQRPMDISRLIDFLFYNWPAGRAIDPAHIGFVGFSRGAFTGLALAGANPEWKYLLNNCPVYPGNRFCEQIRSGPISPMVHDARIKAAVIADSPAGPLFTQAALSGVSIPLLYWASERGGDGVSPDDGPMIVKNLPVKAEFHVAPNSGHFSFLPPCTPEFAALIADDEPELCTDKAGFDRAAFHRQLNTEILGFLSNHLIEANRP